MTFRVARPASRASILSMTYRTEHDIRMTAIDLAILESQLLRERLREAAKTQKQDTK